MKQRKYTKKQRAELDVIKDYFLEATEAIEDRCLKAFVNAKILSRIGALGYRLINVNLQELVYLCLAHGIISRGKACEYLEIDRCDLDDWIKERDHNRS